VFYSISELFTAKIKIKGLEFIGLLTPIKTSEDFISFLKTIRKEHYKATHLCQAYRVGINPITEFHSDDGEPRGSAGQPILNSLKSLELINIAAIVVRYYGGTKLGVRGLIDAYQQCTEEVIQTSTLFSLHERTSFNIQHSYEQQNEIQSLFQAYPVRIESTNYAELVNLTVSLSPEDAHDFELAIKEMEYLGIKNKNLGVQLLKNE
jgi:uncharacterized YigZ family protein